MKKIILILTFLLMASTSWAASLVCDPQAGVTYYILIESGEAKSVPAQTDGSLKYDNMIVGAVYLTAACNSGGCSRTVNLKPSETNNFRAE